MEGQQHRGRSPSTGRHPASAHDLRHSPSPSPRLFHDYNQNLSIDPFISHPNFSSLSFSPSDNSQVGPDVQYSLPSPFLENSSHAPPYRQQHVLPSNGFSDLDQKTPYDHANSSVIHRDPSSSHRNLQPENQQFNTATLISSNSGNQFGNFEQQHSFSAKRGHTLDNTFLLDPQLDMQVQHQSVNPADIMSDMSSPQNMMPTPPNLIPPDHASSSNHGSPQPGQGQFTSPNHSRHASTSLGASVAVNQTQSHGDWTGFIGEQFQTHRRAPSEHSDFSSSVAPSPLLPQHDSFESFDQASPMLKPQQDNQVYHDALGIGQFSISDPKQPQHQEQRFSPGHSPYVSPRMSPHPGYGYPQDQFQLSQDMQNNFNGRPGPEVYPNPSDPSFSLFQHRLNSGDMGQAAQMTPPEISVDLAPPSVPPHFETLRAENDYDALTPPVRGEYTIPRQRMSY